MGETILMKPVKKTFSKSKTLEGNQRDKNYAYPKLLFIFRMAMGTTHTVPAV